VRGQCPTVARASQNVATTATILDTLSAPSTDGVDKVYQQLKDILNIAPMQQVKSPLQLWAKVSALTLDRSRAGGQWTAQGTLKVGTISSPVWISAHVWLSQPRAWLEPQARHQNR
jgi:hypothetical protein